MNNIDKFLNDANDILDAAFEYYLEYQEHDMLKRTNIYKNILNSFRELLTNDSK